MEVCVRLLPTSPQSEAKVNLLRSQGCQGSSRTPESRTQPPCGEGDETALARLALLVNAPDAHKLKPERSRVEHGLGGLAVMDAHLACALLRTAIQPKPPRHSSQVALDQRHSVVHV